MSETERGELTRSTENRTLRRRLEVFYINYTGAVYFLIFEALFIGFALGLGVLGTGAVQQGLRTRTDLTTAWSGVAGGLAIMYALTLGVPLALFYLWDFIDKYR
ncbi:MAG: hypothetical protein ABEH77_00245 [Halobacteriaceae archaeon]